MKMTVFLLVLGLVLGSAGCASDGSFDSAKAMAVGAGVLQAVTLDENSVKQTASLTAKEMDSKNKVAPANSPYMQRLLRITAGLGQATGLNLNYKVYISDQINAFAMADGTVRVYSALLDAMPDDQVLAVIGHEIGHVKLKHSYHQMQTQLLTNSAFAAAISVGGVVGELSASQLGQLGRAVVTAQFSQHDELQADAFSVQLLKRLGKDPYAMKRAIQTLETKYGKSGGFLSSHPSNPKRIENIQKAINHLS